MPRRPAGRTTTPSSARRAALEPLEPRALLSGSIFGHVYHDYNGDGINDPGEPGRAGVIITLDQGSNGSIDFTTKTDASGNYSFAGIPTPATYLLHLKVPAGNIQTTRNTANLALPSNSTITVSDLGTFVLGSVQGRALTDNNAIPEASDPGRGGVLVNLDRDRNGTIDATRVTDADGRYSFPNLGPGDYRVSITDRSDPSDLVPWFAHGTPNSYDFTISSGSSLAGKNFAFAGPNGGAAYVFDTVTSADDAGPGSLRQAITDANADTVPHLIEFDPALFFRTIYLSTSALPTITQPMVIVGPGHNQLTISGNNAFRIFNVLADNVVISGLSLVDGNAQPTGDGGAVETGANGRLTLFDLAVSNCHAQFGGGVDLNSGRTTVITQCTFTGNTATSPGGAIWNGGTLTVSDTFISGNSTAGTGGGISTNGSNFVKIDRSTISDNDSSGAGGGVHTTGDQVTFRLCTITGNTARGGTGGGGVNISGGQGGFESCTIVRNTDVANGAQSAGGITKVVAAQLYLQNSIVSYNFVGTTFADPNLDPVDLNSDINNLRGGDPKLGPLQDNGGSTPTMAPLKGSPVIDAGLDVFLGSIVTDQRGFVRTFGERVDQGAVQSLWFGSALSSISILDVGLAEGAPGFHDIVFSLFRTGDLSEPASVDFATADASALAGTDYEARSGTLVFPAGAAYAGITVRLIGDRRLEPDETFVLNLASATNAIIEDTQAVGTIINDDATPLTNVIPDPFDSSRTALDILGSAGNDTIVVSPGAFPGRVTVKINGVLQGSFDFNGRIIIHAGSGDDSVTISAKLTASAFIYGEDGNDTLKGGSGPDVLLCGPGNDKAFGRNGRDLLFGGDGANRLNAGASDDLLVAGATSFDLGALFSLQSEWTRTGVSYRTRVSHIKNGTGLNTGVALNASTISRGGSFTDTARGDLGRDLFFVKLSGKRGARDLIPDREPGEINVAIA